MNKFVFFVATIITVVIIAVIITNQKYDSKDHKMHGKLNPDLAKTKDRIESVVIRNKGKAIRVLKTPSGWVLQDKYGYPVEAHKIRDLVQASEMIEKVEKKTNNPEKFVRLGLNDPLNEGAGSIRITLMDSTAAEIFADFIVGKKRKSGLIENQPHFYARQANSNQTWLVKSNSYLEINANELINKDAYSIGASRIKSVRIMQANGDSYEISRAAADKDFKIAKNDNKVKDPIILNRMGEIFENNFLIGDVKPEENAPFQGRPFSRAVYQTFDGLTFEVQILKIDGDYWAKIVAEGKNEQASAEAEAINKAARQWAYKVFPESAQLVTKRLGELVRD